MVTAAKTLSQILTHTAVAFSIAYWFTGSVVFGGLAAMLEPVINVAALPVHQMLWLKLRAKATSDLYRRRFLIAEKISQVGMHMGIAFAVMFWATGSVAFGGLAAILEPICNVVLLPFHDRAWEKFRSKVAMHFPHRFFTA